MLASPPQNGHGFNVMLIHPLHSPSNAPSSTSCRAVGCLIRQFALDHTAELSGDLVSLTHTRSLLKISAAVAFVRGCVLDCRQDVFRRPALRALELRDRIGQVNLTDAAVELVRFDTVPAFAAVTAFRAERTLDVFIETPGRHVVAARRLVIDHGRPLSVRTS